MLKNGDMTFAPFVTPGFGWGRISAQGASESGNRFSSRNVLTCLREGAERFGWRAAPRRDGRMLTGTGLAVSTYPARRMASPRRISIASTPTCSTS